ncbi:hypothetical protein M4S82_05335 [Planococcus sp. MERTA32b]|nr:hypothetical protein [Planococcus sp. MER TA 32b]
MDSHKITLFIKKANRRLKLQYLIRNLQIALCFGLASALLIMVISRLSVFPYYEFYAYIAAALTMLTVMLAAISKIPRRQQAISELDQFTPNNQLLTLSQLPVGNLLADDLAKRTEKDIHLSYQLFKKEKNEWLSPRFLLAAVSLLVLAMISGLFPASAQLEAKDDEREQELVEEMVEKVEKQKELADSPEIKKELESLEEKLIESETPEQALRELVKKQKELALKQREKEREGTEQATEEAEELGDASQQLAQQAGNTQTALSEMGKPVAFDLQQSIAANDLSGEPEKNSGTDADGADSEDAASGGGMDGEQAGAGSSENAGESGGEETAGQRGGGSESEGEGSGQGNEGGETSSGEGEGSGAGQGQGSGAGEGSNPGAGAGTGQGSREMLSIPSRIGGSGETTVDNGELSEGEDGSFEEGAVDAERGTIRPYEEVVGSYSDSYFSSANRMKLPPDLRNIIEQYFSSIDGE